MNSTILKKQRNDFIKSVADYSIKYKNILDKVKQINVSLDYSSDTLLYKFICENNDKIVEKINKLLIDVENDKQSALRKINAKIAQLEEQERLERERLEKEEMEQNLSNE